MKVEDVKNIVVVGSGVMGHGIAQIAATAGYDVAMIDVSDEILAKAIEKIKWSLEKFAEKRRVRPEDISLILSRIKTTTSLEDVAGNADVVIEAIPEKIELKKELFAKLDRLTPKHTLLATNTSSLSITEISKATSRPDKVAGMHFFNPPQLMPLCEVIKGQFTSDETISTIVELARKMGKTVVICRKDVRGFIVNRVLGAVFNEAFWTVYRKESTIKEVDASIKYKAGFPMGIFELADYVGLDVLANVAKVMYEAYGERMKPCPLAEPLLNEGKLGQKTGQGFYDWSTGRPRIEFMLAGKYDINRVYSIAVNEAAWLIYEDVADPADIDTGMKLGAGWPSGPCELGDRLGLDVILSKLKDMYSKYNEEMYKPCPLLEDYVSKGRIGKKTGQGFYTYK
jgi:enoyl-CoA hydratase/3-hydroxyacyl-CoA dehydrogenase